MFEKLTKNIYEKLRSILVGLIVIIIFLFGYFLILGQFSLGDFATLQGLVDTLRYFYSALFQGFAALLALGSMYYLYFKQLSNSELQNFLIEISRCIKFTKNPISIYKDEILEKAKKMLDKKEPNKSLDFYYTKYKNLAGRIIRIESLIKNIVFYSVIILILSLLVLLNIGINQVHTVVGYYIGLILVFVSAIIFVNIHEVIIITIGRRKGDDE